MDRKQKATDSFLRLNLSWTEPFMVWTQKSLLHNEVIPAPPIELCGYKYCFVPQIQAGHFFLSVWMIQTQFKADTERDIIEKLKLHLWVRTHGWCSIAFENNVAPKLHTKPTRWCYKSKCECDDVPGELPSKFTMKTSKWLAYKRFQCWRSIQTSVLSHYEFWILCMLPRLFPVMLRHL